MSPTSISWVRGPDGAPGFSWNPVVGCTAVSPGCANCWAARLASTRLAHLPEYKGLAKDGKWIGGARFLPDRLDQPLRKRKPAGIAVGLMGDLFHESITDEQIAAVFGVMAACQQHRFFVLTKRAKRMREWFEWIASKESLNSLQPWEKCALASMQTKVNGLIGIGGVMHVRTLPDDRPWPLSHVFVGVSIEDQATADERIPELLQTPAAVRFVSYEPAIGPVQFHPGTLGCVGHIAESFGNPLIHQIIVGGESGPSAHPCHVEWIRSIVQQCRTAGVACFVKQIIVDGKLVKEVEQFPDDLQIREFPSGNV